MSTSQSVIQTNLLLAAGACPGGIRTIEGKCLGGSPVPRAAIDEALSHLQNWTVMGREILLAEFPEFDLVSALSVFGLPENCKKLQQTPDQMKRRKAKTERLSRSFKQPSFSDEFEDHLPFALREFSKSCFGITYGEAWRLAVKTTQSIRNAELQHPCGALVYVLKREKCYGVSTSGIESDFSTLALRLPAQRLNASAASEERTASLILADLNDDDVRSLCAHARQIWETVFPGVCQRTHSKFRSDKGLFC